MLLQEGGPLPGPKGGSGLTLRSELSEETHALVKPEALLGRVTPVESRGVREPGRTALPRGSRPQVLWWWSWFPGCLWAVTLIQGPSWWPVHRSAKMGSGRLVGHMGWDLLSPFDLP